MPEEFPLYAMENIDYKHVYKTDQIKESYYQLTGTSILKTKLIFFLTMTNIVKHFISSFANSIFPFFCSLFIIFNIH